jgi:hypothetical protein
VITGWLEPIFRKLRSNVLSREIASTLTGPATLQQIVR